VQNTWRRAGAMYGAIGQIVLLTIVAGLLAAGITLPAIAIAGLATRDTANTFNNLPVGTLGNVPQISTVYDVEGNPIAKFYPGDIYRVPVLYDQIAPIMRNAIVAIEDSTFYNQGALDPRGTARALFSNSSGGQLQGASTLAQQYVKNVRLLQAGNNKAAQSAAIYPGFSRKITQLRIAATVEHSMTQQGLLAAYLNVAFFGEQAYGIQVAAERYFSVPASKLTLIQAADLAGIVQSPTAYDPRINPVASRTRRDEVLNRMAQLHYISKATATAAEQLPIKLNMSAAPLQTGCSSPLAARSAYFCDYVEHVLVNQYPQVWNQMIKGTGGLKIYTTLNMRDQNAATNAVNFVEPHWSGTYNPGRNADTEVLIQPGTGAVRAIAIDRRYGNGPGENEVDYAVNSEYGGSATGVQTGSSSKIFTLITALKQGLPFGHQIKVISPATVGPYYNCSHDLAGGGANVAPGFFSVVNAEGDTPKGGEFYQLYSGTVGSINVYFAQLEKQVGLCNVVKTAVDMGMTRADGKSLLKGDKIPGGIYQYPADSIPSFTLGSVGVSPMSMAAAYASVAARGWYCEPKALTKIVTASGQQVKLLPNSCHRDMSKSVADAANYILQGVLVSGTAAGREIGRPAAGKTGTANGGYYAAFGGYTPTLAGYVSVFNPVNPTTGGAMLGSNSCFRQVGIFPGTGVQYCPGQMYGNNAPGATWEYTFLHAQLGQAIPFVSVPSNSLFFSEGLGNAPKAVNPPKKKKGHGPGGPGGGPSPTITPPPTR
jgi:membrane peptidoglycan carboxypeptidase